MGIECRKCTNKGVYKRLLMEFQLDFSLYIFLVYNIPNFTLGLFGDFSAF